MRRACCCLLLLLLGPLAARADPELRVLLDLDDDAGTGCDVTTPEGTFAGAELVVVATTDANAREIAALETQACNTGTGLLDPPVPEPGATPPWSIGDDLGLAGGDVVELLVTLSIPLDGRNLRLAAMIEDASGGDALLDVGGQPILFFWGVPQVPGLHPLWLAPLALLLLGGARSAARRCPRSAAWIVATGVGASAWVAIAAENLDGQPGDWTDPALATDPAGDAPAGVDLHALFATREGSVLCLRLDAAVNEPPSTSGLPSLNPLEDATDDTLDLFAAFSDPEDPDASLAFSVTSNSNPALFDGVSVVSDELVLDYATDANGMALITVRATDTGGLFVEAVADVDVSPINDPPTLDPPPPLNVIADAGLVQVTVAGIDEGGGVDEEAQSLSLSAMSSDASVSGAVTTFYSGDQTTGTVEFSPPARTDLATATITVTVMDSGGGTDTTSRPFVLTVGPSSPVSIGPVQDNSMWQEGELSSGIGPHLYAGRALGLPNPMAGGAPAERRRALLAFDLPNLPPGASVTSAHLVLQLTTTGDASTRIFALHRVTQSWGEGVSSAANGMGAAPQAGDATWVRRLWPSSSWTTTGGSFAASASAIANVGTAPGAVIWSSAGLAADLNAWLAAPSSNHGWLLKVVTETTIGTARQLGSRENPSPSLRPELVVTYAIP